MTQKSNKLKDDFKLRELKLITEKDNLSANYTRYQDDLKKELDIREEIVNRYTKYSAQLQKQVAVCKNVIKNPKLMTDAMRKYNYDELQLYKYSSAKEEDMLSYRDTKLNTVKNKDLSSDHLHINKLDIQSYNRVSTRKQTFRKNAISRGMIRSKMLSQRKDTIPSEKRPATCIDYSPGHSHGQRLRDNCKTTTPNYFIGKDTNYMRGPTTLATTQRGPKMGQKTGTNRSISKGSDREHVMTMYRKRSKSIIMSYVNPPKTGEFVFNASIASQ